MGVEFGSMNCHYEYGKDFDHVHFPKQVIHLACKVLEPLTKDTELKASHLIVATTCPDNLAPSLGQELNKYFHPFFSDVHVIDIVQGCAGGVSALLLASQLAEINNKKVVVVIADAAKKACDKENKDYDIFGNGSFSCVVSPNESLKGLIHFKSRQYPELTEVVSIKLGHDADEILINTENISQNPRKYFGLKMNRELAIELMVKAISFYEEFIKEVKTDPDVLILHQVNPKIIAFLSKIFSKKGVQIINVSELVGNCGAASVGITLKLAEKELTGKKVAICSFGTGGVITTGMWQF